MLGTKKMHKKGSRIIMAAASLIMLIHALVNGTVADRAPEQKLVEKLLSEYNPKLRPVKNFSESLVIWLKLDGYQLIDVDNKEQIIKFHFWVNEIWKDEFLTWDPEEYNNVTSVRLPNQDIWKPDTHLFTNINLDPARTMTSSFVKIYRPPAPVNWSYVKFDFGAVYFSACSVNVRFFPWDIQLCEFKFGSFVYDVTKVRYLTKWDHVNLAHFRNNHLWEIVSFDAQEINETYYYDENPQFSDEETPNTFANIIYRLKIRRRPIYYIFNFIVPAFVTIQICFLGLFSPSSSSGPRNEKVTLGITTVMALSIYLLIICDHLPETSSAVPMIGWYFVVLIALIGIALVATVCIMNLQVSLERSGQRSKFFKKKQRANNGLTRYPQNSLLNREETMETLMGTSTISRALVDNIVDLKETTRDIMEDRTVKEETHAHQMMIENYVLKLERICFVVFICTAWLSTGAFLVVGYVMHEFG